MKSRTDRAAALVMVAALVLCGGATYGFSPDSPETEDADRIVAVIAGRIIPVEGDEIENGIIVIKNGVIEAVGANIDYPREADVIHAEELVVMPGLVNPCTSIGLKTFNRKGVLCNLKVSDEFELDEDSYEKLLSSGFTTFGMRPHGSSLPGQAMAFKPVGSTRADWTLDSSAYLLINMTNPSKEKAALEKALDTAKKEIEKQEKARKDWEEKQKKEAEKKKAAEEEKKKSEKKGEEKNGNGQKSSLADDGDEKTEEKEKKEEPAKFTPPPINPAYKPLVDLIKKEKDAKALVVLSRASDLVHFREAVDGYDIAFDFCLENGSRSLRRASSTDLAVVKDEFGTKGAAVVLRAVINFKPSTTNRMNLSALLAEAGCEVSLTPPLDSVAEHESFLRSLGRLMKAGLGREAALNAITLHPARILGLGDRVGSLEKGKDANLLFLSDDPFDPLARVEKVMIEGVVAAEGQRIQ